MERLTADLNIIQTLPDQPAMTGAELKAKFDEAGNIIKDFLNDQLLDELEDWQDELEDSITSQISELTESLETAMDELSDSLTGQMSSLETSLKSYVNGKVNDLSGSLSTLTTKMSGALLVKTWRETNAWHDGASGDHDRDYSFAVPSGYTFLGLFNPFNNSGNHHHYGLFYVRSASASQVTVSCYFHASDQARWTYGFSLLFAKTNSNIATLQNY